MKKIYILIVLILLITLLSSCVFINSVRAAKLYETINLHSDGNCGQLLKYKGVIVKCYYVEHEYDGVKYPAYCLDKTLEGVNDEFAYSVEVTNKITDVGLWNVIINGYPYKTLKELGVESKEEAFTATKQAIYCYLNENTPEDYEAIGEAGIRTLNALKKIIDCAGTSTQMCVEPKGEILEVDSSWLEENEYIYKKYSVKTNCPLTKYNINIEGLLKDEIMVEDNEGNLRTEFLANENFTVKMPKNVLKENGTFNIEVKTNSETKPVMYGLAPNSQLQNYALTGFSYEDILIKYEESYSYYDEPTKKDIVKKESFVPDEKVLPVTGM